MTVELIKDLDSLDRHLAASHGKDVWFFKHSLICGVSTAAQREFDSFAAEGSTDGEARFCMVEIQPARDVSRALAERLSVRHQSPQVILVRRGEAVWHASHWSITRRALAEASREVVVARAP